VNPEIHHVLIFLDILFSIPPFSSPGFKLEQFIEAMSLKMAAQDEDEQIRQTFLVFDSQCNYYI
jgi:Ca2+-binding EF-hand superfamily protein